MFKPTLPSPPPFFSSLPPDVANKTKGRPHSLHFNKIKLFGATLLQSLLESGINCTQRSHRREKSLRINIDSGMHLFAGIISKEEGFPQDNGGSPRVLALGRQPWVTPAEVELSEELVTQQGYPVPIHPVFSMHILQEKPVLRPLLDTPQSRSTRAAVLLPTGCLQGQPKALVPRLSAGGWGTFRQGPRHTRSPAGGARSAQAVRPWWWGRRCSPQVQI